MSNIAKLTVRVLEKAILLIFFFSSVLTIIFGIFIYPYLALFLHILEPTDTPINLWMILLFIIQGIIVAGTLTIIAVKIHCWANN